jgi:hypothetical protein
MSRELAKCLAVTLSDATNMMNSDREGYQYDSVLATLVEHVAVIRYGKSDESVDKVWSPSEDESDRIERPRLHLR